MIGVTIGVGEKWFNIARRASDRMEEMTGLECVVIRETMLPIKVAHPSWIKCKILDIFPHVNEFLVFDADIIAHGNWDPEYLFRIMKRAFCAVPDSRDRKVFDECNALGIPFPDIYLNGGLLLFGREHAPVWELVWKRHPGPFGKWLEQGALNVALLEVGCEVCRLPRQYNQILHVSELDKIDSRDINLHFCGTGDADNVLEIQSKMLNTRSDPESLQCETR